MRKKTIITVSAFTGILAIVISVFILTGNKPRVEAPQTDNHVAKKADVLKHTPETQKNVPGKNENLTENRTEPVPVRQVQEKLAEDLIISDEEPRDEEIEQPEEENQREIERMKQALPGNMWIPGEPSEEEAEEQQQMLKHTILLEKKIRKDTATNEEKRVYYGYKIKMVQDRIDVIQYYQKRTSELETEGNRPYLTKEDIEQGNKAVAELEYQREEYDKLLSEVPE
ncbi:MAG: hypothetical protein GY749_49245 [Desulfobacteraceae bacterium]|nr:hypothetical protein [Desulfobacteraceae bacterium]